MKFAMANTQPTTANSVQKRSQRKKIAIIGGGSPYCAGLMRGFVQQADNFRGCHITLMDVDADGLELIYTIASKLFKHASVELTLERTTNQKAAISEADFVLTTFRTGGMKARYLDEKIPLRHGLIGQETVGPGGFFYSLRTVPEVAGIAAEMEKVAPKAFLLNYTNPSNIVTEAIAHCSGIRVIGLCDGPFHEIQRFANLAGVDAASGKRLYHRTVGLNHGNWTTAVWREGIDVLPEIIAWCENYIETQAEMTPANYELRMLAMLVANYKAIPSHYMHYYYYPEQVLEFLRNKPTTRAEDIMATIPALIEHFREEAEIDVPRLTKMRGSGGFGDFALEILRSILHDTGEEWILNTQNQGAINFLAND